MPSRVFLGVLALCLTAAPLVAQGRLDEVGRDVQQPPPTPAAAEDGFVGELIGAYLAGVLEAACESKDEAEESPRMKFLPYPYARDYPGLMRLSEPVEGKDAPTRDVPLRIASGRLRIDESNDFDGLNRLGGQLMIDTSSGLGFRAGYQWLHETFWCGCTDNLGLGDVNVLYRVAGLERFQMHVGVGVVFLSDARRTDGGVNLTASFDVFPVKPLVIATQFDVGSVGNATVSHVRGTVGYLWKRFELFGGYDYLRIGSVNLSGPVGGLRLWF